VRTSSVFKVFVAISTILVGKTDECQWQSIRAF
jgi:hypothetical protein